MVAVCSQRDPASTMRWHHRDDGPSGSAWNASHALFAHQPPTTANRAAAHTCEFAANAAEMVNDAAAAVMFRVTSFFMTRTVPRPKQEAGHQIGQESSRPTMRTAADTTVAQVAGRTETRALCRQQREALSNQRKGSGSTPGERNSDDCQQPAPYERDDINKHDVMHAASGEAARGADWNAQHALENQNAASVS